MKLVTYIQYTNPAAYPPLLHSSKLLADSGCSVEFLGTGTLGSDSLDLPPHERVTLHRMGYGGQGLKQKFHFLAYICWVVARCFRRRPDVVYCSDVWACPVGLLLHWCGFHVIYHEHDAPPPEASSFFQRAVLACRKRLVARVDSVAPSRGRCEILTSVGARRCHVVWNCPSIDEVAAAPQDKSLPPLKMVYQGSIVPARLPLELLDAIASQSSKGATKLRIIGYETGRSGYVERLLRRADELGIQDDIDYLGPMCRGDLLRAIGDCHIGLALMPMNDNDVNHQSMVGASNKPFDYMSQGLAMLVSDLPAWRELYVNEGLAVACDSSSVTSLSQCISRLHESKQMLEEMGQRGIDRIRQCWNYDTQFEKIRSRMTMPRDTDPRFEQNECCEAKSSG